MKDEKGMQLTRINLPRVDSTNNFCRDMLPLGDGHEGMTLVVAEQQTAGRGQQGSQWESAAGQNLLFSLMFQPQGLKASEQFILSQCMALALCRSLSKRTDGVSIKWPNDIYIYDGKVSGTLIECDLRGKEVETCIIGVGVNVNQERFTSDAPNPVSLIQITRKESDREQLLCDITDEFLKLYALAMEGKADQIRQEYKENLYRRKGLHPYEDVRGEFLAEIADVEPTGHLVLRFENGNTCRYEFKQVKYIFYTT